MTKRKPMLYDAALRRIGELDGAMKVSYKDSCTDMGTCSFSLATADPRCDEIVIEGSYIQLFDGEKDKGFYRITGMPEEDDRPGGLTRYTCDQAQCTLLDDLLDGYHEIGGIEMRTADCLAYILSQQEEGRWALGECDFDDAFSYCYSSANALDAIYAIGKTLIQPYRFDFDTTTLPWTVSLRRLSDAPRCQLIKGRNMQRIKRRISGSVITRLYGLGYGEGDNQLTIASVNDGKPYIDADTIGTWGIRKGMHVDTSITDPATLKAHMEQLLEQVKQPAISYTATALDIRQYTGESWDDVQVGDLALVMDYRFKKPFTARVIERSKDDVLADNPSVSFTLETAARSTADELNELRDTVGVHELYAQGATTIYAEHFADNASPEFPCTFNFRIPASAIRINSVLLSWDIEKYRAYTKGAAAGGASVATSREGGGGTKTSSAGGGATVTVPAQTVSTGVKFTSGPMDGEDGSSAGLTGGPKDYAGSASTGTGSAGAHTHNMTHCHALSGHDHEFTGTSKSYSIGHNHSLAGDGAATTGAIYSGVSSITVKPSGSVESSGTLWTGSPYESVGGGTKSATGENGGHSHTFDHVHNMPHVHDMAHEHTIPAMSFALTPHSHDVTLPGHTHEIELEPHEHEAIFDIYEGGKAKTITLIVDGSEVPAEAIEGAEEIDIAPYMRKNDDGKISRNARHTVKVVPDGATRIVADLFVQMFIQSRGAGDY